MKVMFMGTLVDSKGRSPLGMTMYLTERLNRWWGKESGANVIVSQVDEHTIQFDLYRHYGNYYESPERCSTHSDSIFSFDKQLILGTEYSDTPGNKVDLEEYSGRYVIYYANDDFFYDYKQAAKAMGASNIKALEFQHFNDHFTFKVTTYARF